MKRWTDRSSPLFASRLSLLVCIGLAAGGVLLGYFNGSIAVTTNGLISAVDIINSFFFLAAVNQSVKSPDYIFNYGYGKYESLAMLGTGGLLTALLGYTLYDAIITYGDPAEYIDNYTVLVGFSFVSFVVMRQMFLFQRRAARRYHMTILDYDAKLWLNDSFIELGVLINLIIGFVFKKFELEGLAKIIDSTTGIGLAAFALWIPMKSARDALNQLLDRTLPENIQFDIIAVIAENIQNMCEYKSIHTRQAGKDLFIEIDIVMPWDFTLDKVERLEKQIHTSIKVKYPTAITRVYVEACPKDCLHNGKRNCPIKIKGNPLYDPEINDKK